MSATIETIEMEREFSRGLCHVLEIISTMIGMEDAHNPHGGPWDVVVALDEFVAKVGHGTRLGAAERECSEQWLEQMREHEKPTALAHMRGVEAYFAALESARPSPIRGDGTP